MTSIGADFRVLSPEHMNPTFARAFNSRQIANLMALYEPGAILRTDGSGRDHTGLAEIQAELSKLLQAPGVMVSNNNFCIRHGDIALLRADYVLRNGEIMIAKGSTAEIVRQQPDGTWLYVIDHAAAGSLPSVTP